MAIEPALLKNISDYLVHILIFFGAVGGSLKASAGRANVKDSKLLNVLIGIFCGIAVAGHYSAQLSPFLAGILSLAVSSVSIVVLEDVILLAPKLLDWWISRKFEIDKDEIEDFRERYTPVKKKAPKPKKPADSQGSQNP